MCGRSASSWLTTPWSRALVVGMTMAGLSVTRTRRRVRGVTRARGATATARASTSHKVGGNVAVEHVALLHCFGRPKQDAVRLKCLCLSCVRSSLSVACFLAKFYLSVLVRPS